jgi:hypothetical protein
VTNSCRICSAWKRSDRNGEAEMLQPRRRDTVPLSDVSLHIDRVPRTSGTRLTFGICSTFKVSADS